MSKFYFANLPTFIYNGKPCVDLMTRVKIRDNLRINISEFFKYQIKDGERADGISNDYYNDSSYDWLIYLINDIIDPYYDWPLSQSEFVKFIINKYGSIQVASEKILFWNTNWYDDNSILTIAGYNALPATLRKYWNPIIKQGNIITQYKRANIDIFITTNKIVELEFVSPITIPYAMGAKIIRNDDSLSYGEVCLSNVNAVNIQNVFGTFNDSDTYTIQNEDGTNSTSVIATTLIQNIPINEVVYYEAISAYQNEINMNHKKSFILLLRKEFLGEAEQLVAAAFS
jgi:hypothetical protein